MAQKKQLSIVESGRELGGYRPEAFEFLRDGLDYTVRRTHGAKAKTVRKIIEWLQEHQSDLADLPDLLEQGSIPHYLMNFIEEIGGLEQVAECMNLHVDGEDLCWGLRDLAQERWGLMAQAVLRHWGIRSTTDFGRMVFALVDRGLLAKQPEDDISDFEGVYDFTEVFERCFKLDLAEAAQREAQESDECMDDEELDPE